MAYTTINKPRTHFANFGYMGDDAAPHALTGMGLQPDLLWLKNRERASSQAIWDIQRGVNMLRANSTAQEEAKSDRFTSINSDGFTVTGGDDDTNRNADAYSAFGWEAGGAASSNYDGSITTQVSVNATSNFSIVTYVGTGSAATIGHGLGAIPELIIVKNLTDVENWPVYTKYLGNAQKLYLSETDSASAATQWNSTTPTSSVISIGTHNSVNDSGDDYVAYCFAPIKGYSAVGHYLGNGETDGPFIYTGFKPAWVMVKETAAGGGWLIWNQDPVGGAMTGSVNVEYNVITSRILANTNAARDTGAGNSIDFCATGFKIRTDDGDFNADGQGAIYVAFAQNTLVGTNDVPGTAV